MTRSQKSFEFNFFATVVNANEPDLRISERHVSEDLSPLEDTKRTDFEIFKITKHVIFFLVPLYCNYNKILVCRLNSVNRYFKNNYMLNKHFSKNNKTFTYKYVSSGIFRKESAEMVDNLLLYNDLSIY